jgi:heme-degrading monooxygenase HmoA
MSGPVSGNSRVPWPTTTGQTSRFISSTRSFLSSHRAEAFTAAYAADGAWGDLFDRAAGFLGTELYRDAARADRFLTIDRWQDERDWRSFLNAFNSAYEALDA